MSPLTITAGGTLPLPRALVERARDPQGRASLALVYPRPDPGAGRLLILTPDALQAVRARIAAMPRGSLERAAAERVYVQNVAIVTARPRSLRLPARLAWLFAPLPCPAILEPGPTGLVLRALPRPV